MATKTPPNQAPRRAPPLTDNEQKKLALNLLLDAWDAALQRGVEPEVLATTAIYAAVTDMVDIHGEEPVAEMLSELPERIRRGAFTPGD